MEDLPQHSPFEIDIAREDAEEAWVKIVNVEYDNTNLQHRVMAKYYAKQYAQAMADFFGIGTAENYLLYAYDGLAIPPDDPVCDNWDEMINDANEVDNYNCN